ncbi:hypothetical protein YC2023_091369 [Brassica napus]
MGSVPSFLTKYTNDSIILNVDPPLRTPEEDKTQPNQNLTEDETSDAGPEADEEHES